MYANGFGTTIDTKKALACYITAANLGDILAHSNLGYIYETEMEDLAEAIKWYEKAAKKSEPHAIEALERLAEDNEPLAIKALETLSILEAPSE